jgi:hypothetical protein
MGVVPGFTGLTRGSEYYLSNTAGGIATSAGDNEKVVGIAVSATEILIKNPHKEALTSKAQTIAGIKTFSSIPVGPASNPTSDNQLARKKYVDDHYKGFHTCNVSLSLTRDSDWHNIDLSGTVGSRSVLAIIKLYDEGYNTNGWIQFMNADETDVDGVRAVYDYFNNGANKVRWNSSTSGTTDDLVYVMVPTNSSGVIKGQANIPADITLVGWIG